MAQKSRNELQQAENLESTQDVYLQPISSESGVRRYPWQEGISNTMLPDLKKVKTQISSNMPYELVLRLDFLLRKRNVGFNRKVCRGDLINEAIDLYTKLQLAEIGYKIDGQ